MTKAKQTAAERLQAHSLEFLLGRSDLIGVEVALTGKIINEDGSASEVDLGQFSAIPRLFSSGNRGFYMFGKVQDPTINGQMNEVEYQCGFNVTACKSKDWPVPE